MTSSNASASSDAARRAADVETIRCACCGSETASAESKACATCRQLICPACTRWYGHFMLVCDDCHIASW